MKKNRRKSEIEIRKKFCNQPTNQPIILPYRMLIGYWVRERVKCSDWWEQENLTDRLPPNYSSV